MNTEWNKSKKGISIKELEQLIDEHQLALVNYACFIVGSILDAEDIVQESFVKFFKQSIPLRDQSKAKAYLYRMVNNASIDFIRSNRFKKTISIDSMSDLPDQKINGHSLEGFESEFHKINNMLSQIPKEQSKIIRMRTISNLSFVEISQILEIPVSTVKSRFKYGIDKLRQKTSIKKEVYYDM